MKLRKKLFLIIIVQGLILSAFTQSVNVDKLSNKFYNICFDYQLRPNNLVFNGPDGALIVDTGHDAMSARLKTEVKKINEKGLKYIVNSHDHHDHVGGNNTVKGNGIIIGFGDFQNLSDNKILMPGKKTLLGEDGFRYDEYSILNFNGESIFLIPQQGVHSNVDILTYFPSEAIVHTGDLYLSQSFPAIDDVKAYLQILQRMIAVFPDNTKFVPGHGKISTKNDLIKYNKMLLETIKVVRNEMKNTKDLEEIVKNKPLAKWTSWGEFLTFLNIDNWTKDIYNSYIND